MSETRQKKKKKGISRIDSGSTHGWFVRVYRNGKTYSKLYSDKKYGGKEKALRYAEKAQELAQESIEQIPKKYTERMVTNTSRNKTGIVGVSKTRKKNRSGTHNWYYQVTWTEGPGVVKNKQWSISKYGDREALKMAVNFRDEIMQDKFGERYEEWKREEYMKRLKARQKSQK